MAVVAGQKVAVGSYLRDFGFSLAWLSVQRRGICKVLNPVHLQLCCLDQRRVFTRFRDSDAHDLRF